MLFASKKYLTTLFYLLSIVVYGQENSYTAVLVYGNVQLLHAESKKWEMIHPGDKLEDSDNIQLTNNAYIGLINKKGNTFEVRREGFFSLKMLPENINSRQASTQTISLLDSIVENISYDNSFFEFKPKYKFTDIAFSYSTCKCEIPTLLGSVTMVYNDTLYLYWRSNERHRREYLMRLTNMFDEDIISYTIDDTTALIPVQSVKETMFAIELSFTDQPDTKVDFKFHKLSKENSTKIKSELQRLRVSLGNNTPGLNDLLLAYYFKKRGLDMYFYHYLYRSIKKADGVKLYSDLYNLNARYK